MVSFTVFSDHGLVGSRLGGKLHAQKDFYQGGRYPGRKLKFREESTCTSFKVQKPVSDKLRVRM